MPGLHVITDDAILSRPDFQVIATAILQSLQERVAFHLRARQLHAAELYDLAERLTAVASRALVLINDRIDIAAATRAAGVQLGARSLPIAHARTILGPAALIGYSAHSQAEAERAEADGANFLLLGTIYRSESHPELPPVGTGLIVSTARRCHVPILAIGGITIERVREIRAAGATGVAVIRAIWNARDPVHAADELAKMIYHHADSTDLRSFHETQ